MLVDYAITTVSRKGNYIHELLASLPSDLEVRLVVGSSDSDYLARYRGNPLIHVLEPSPEEWRRVCDRDIWARATWNHWRSLSSRPTSPDHEGRLIFEDDVVLAKGWQPRLFDTIDKIRTRFGPEYVLALYCPYKLRPEEPIRQYAPYAVEGFYGAQALYYPEALRVKLAEYVAYHGVDLHRLPFDLLIKEYFHNHAIPLLATVPSLAQHIGRITTGLGDFHQAPIFQPKL
jgi:hypothetical protein